MARKSAVLRKQQLETLKEGYNNNQASKSLHQWDYSFIEAMILRMTRGKALTKKMRSKIDELIDGGIKPVPDNAEADEMQRLSTFLIDRRLSEALLSFATRLRQGRTLTEKQANFAEQLLQQAREIENNGHWEPNEETRKKMNLVCRLSPCYSEIYWQTHAAGSRAIRQLKRYIQGLDDYILEKTWESAKHAVRGKLKMIEEPKFAPGDKCFIKTDIRNENGDWVTEKLFGIICSPPLIHRKNIGYDVLLNGQCQPWPADRINKR
tara:strand:- start:285 stop:1079 length:795 start_codon:yes stop_codon:yes gene_type:complete